MKKVKQLAENISDKASSQPPGVRYVGLEHIASWTGQFVATDDNSLQAEAESTVSKFAENDVLFGKLRPYLAKAVIADSAGVCTTELLVLRPKSVIPRYFLRAILMEPFIREVSASTYGAKMPRADWTFIGNQLLPQPPHSEQLAIAAFLDAETTRIDELITEKELLIETLHEFSRSIFFDALMAAASTGSGCPARIGWLPAIPLNWTCCKVKHIVEKFDQGISPQCETRPPNEDEWGVLKVGCVNTGLFDPQESKALPPDLPTFDEITLREGDVMISRANTRNLVGRCAAADKLYPKLMLSDKLYRLRLDRQRCEPSFLVDLLALPAIRARIEERATGASASMLNIDRRTILELDIVLPPLDTQKSIVRQTQDKRQGIHKLVEHVSSEIALLREFRSTTISDAVLGRFRVA